VWSIAAFAPFSSHPSPVFLPPRHGISYRQRVKLLLVHHASSAWPHAHIRSAPNQPMAEETPALEEPHLAQDALERHDTELQHIRTRYSQVSSHRRPRSITASNKPNTVGEHIIHSISKFWRRQIRVSVEHGTSRDHLGPLPFLPLFCFIIVEPALFKKYRFFNLAEGPEDSLATDQVICYFSNFNSFIGEVTYIGLGC
jgi:hypothetical protein